MAYTIIPPEVAADVSAQLATAIPSRDCVPWKGVHSIPAGPDKQGMAVITHGLHNFMVARVALAISRGEDRVQWCHARFSCRNSWCVNPDHIKAYEVGRSGRTRLALEDTGKYQERLSFCLSKLTDDPQVSVEQLFAFLRQADLGGNSATMSRIIQQARTKLGLPLRVSKVERAEVDMRRLLDDPANTYEDLRAGIPDVSTTTFQTIYRRIMRERNAKTS